MTACGCGRPTIRRASGWWCTYCHRTAKPARKAVEDRHRRYREANREKRAAYNRQWYRANRERLLVKHRRYREANRDRIAAQRREYLARRKAAAA